MFDQRALFVYSCLSRVFLFKFLDGANIDARINFIWFYTCTTQKFNAIMYALGFVW